jgi:hypothetical protein
VQSRLELQGSDLLLAGITFLVDLVLLGANEGSLIDVGVHLDIGVVTQLESVLPGMTLADRYHEMGELRGHTHLL